MVITNDMAKDYLKEYSNKNCKINRDVKAGKLHKIITGLYETDPNTPEYLLAGCIYGPSYISFEYALAYYGLIPERVTAVTCATCNKKKKKQYITDFGVFTYRDIPQSVYSDEILIKVEGNYSYIIATPEKALCDKLYTLKPLKNYNNLKIMLFSDLRIDEEEFSKLNGEIITQLSKFYHSTNVTLLAKYIQKTRKEN